MTATPASPRFVVVGIPGNRRIDLFQAALAARGLPAADVVGWGDVIERGAAAAIAALPDEPTVFRIDSAGEDFAVECALLKRGEAAARAGGFEVIERAAIDALAYDRGRIVHPRQHHLGFVAVLDDLAAALADRPTWRVVQPPAAIALLFDKRATSALWRGLGIAVPDILAAPEVGTDEAGGRRSSSLAGDAIRDPGELRARIAGAGWDGAFVKLTCGSSASCLAYYVRDARRGDHAITTVEDTGRARYNTLKLQRVTGARLDRLLAFLLAEGAIVERAIPKARLDGRYFDCRVLTIAGDPAFVVVRSAPHPITNLHLGGQRGDLGALRHRVAPAAWDAAMDSCRAVQRSSGAFHVGVDLMFEPDFATHRVIEGNAFGDLLPNLERDGLDVYGWQIRCLLEHGE
jgi:hypothetical protein